MNGWMSWLAWVVAAVVLVAIAVAWWEQRRRLARQQQERPWAEAEQAPSEQRGTQVDVNLDPANETAELPAQTQTQTQTQTLDAARDPSARRAVLEQALSRMAADSEARTLAPATPAAEADAWADTEPLVALGRSHRVGEAFAETLPAELAPPLQRGG